MADLISQMGPRKSSSSASASDAGPTHPHGIRSEHQQILTYFSLSRVRPPRSLSASAPPATSGRPQWSKEVWNPASVPYDKWVTTLTSTLIRHGLPNPLKESTWKPTDEVQILLRLLGACQRACQVSLSLMPLLASMCTPDTSHCVYLGQANAALAETLLPTTVLGMIKVSDDGCDLCCSGRARPLTCPPFRCPTGPSPDCRRGGPPVSLPE